MSRRERRARRAGAAPGRTPRRPRRAWLAPALAIGVAALAVAAWLLRPQPGTRVAVSLTDGMSAEEAYAAGLTRGKAGHHLESVAYFLAAVRLAPNSWTARENYANALNNGAQESRIHLGKDEPATRSSFERVAMIREAMGQSIAAERLAQTDHDRALIGFQRAQTLYTFGLVSDADQEFRRALALSPTSPAIAGALELSSRRLRNGGGPE